MLTQEVKQRVLVAMKEKNVFERDLLKVVLGDLQMGATRKGGDLTEDEEHKIVRSMVKSMNETIAADPSSDAAAQAKKELVIVESLLPKSLSADEVKVALEPVTDAIKAAPNDGAATGVAMKHLKPTGATVDGKVVSQVVRELRA